MSIRIKLTIQFTIIIALVLIMFSVSLYYFSASYRKKDYFERLESRARTTARLLIDTEEIDEKLLSIIDRGTSALYRETVEVYDSNEELIYKSGYGYPFKFNDHIRNYLKDNELTTFKNILHEAVLLKHNVIDRQFFVYVSAYDKYGHLKLKNLINILLIGLGFGIILSFFFGYFLSVKALSPINTIISQVNTITASNLKNRIDEGNGKDELAMLAITFNNMLQRLDMAFEMQKNFVNNASHEFRTPLTLIMGEIELSMKQDADIPKYKSILGDIYNDIKSLNNLSNDLLDLAYVSLDESNILLGKVRVDEVLIQVSGEMHKRKTNYTIDLSFGEMPDDPQKLTIVGNEFFLKTVFANLISNACKYSENHSVKIHFSVSNNSIITTFTDEGIGIPEDELDKVFQPFYRARNQKNRQGHGIGLALVDKVINLHKGSIKVSSSLDVGTIFTVEFNTSALPA